jgi:hypothetical protein
MNGNKPWWTSKTIRGAAACILAGVLGLSSADAQDIVEILVHFGSIAGGAMAIYGRRKATQRIGGSE